MKLMAFSLLNKKNGIFNPPFFVRTKADALDLVHTYFSKEENKKNADNYVLYLIGEFDDENGSLSAIPAYIVKEDE